MREFTASSPRLTEAGAACRACLSWAGLIVASQVRWLKARGSLTSGTDRLLLGVLGAILLGLATWFLLTLLVRRGTLDRGARDAWLRGLAASLVLIPGVWIDRTFPLASLVLAFLVGGWVAGSDRIRGWIEMPAGGSERAFDPGRTQYALALLATAAVLVYLRAPQLLTEPRLWAEDAGHALSYTYGEPLAYGLVRFVEYFRLFSNVAAVLAVHVFPLEQAALVFTAVAFAVKLIPVAVAATSRCMLRNTSRAPTARPHPPSAPCA